MIVAFIITSALNTKFGVFSAEQRMQQTLDTIKSIRSRCPDTHITIVDMGGGTLKAEQIALLQNHCELVVDFTQDPTVQKMYSNDNWDVVKSATEMMCFGEILKRLDTHPAYKDVTRIFKISGRYVLNDDFQLSYYDQDSVADMIVIGAKKYSQFTPVVTGGAVHQYMSRCWSFPRDKIPEVAAIYDEMLQEMIDRVNAGGYIDIEHCLYKFLPADNIIEKTDIGVQGLLGPNGVAVKD